MAMLVAGIKEIVVLSKRPRCWTRGPIFRARSWRSVCWATADAGEAAAQEQGPGSG
jgi:hypothetical protein